MGMAPVCLILLQSVTGKRVKLKKNIHSLIILEVEYFI